MISNITGALFGCVKMQHVLKKLIARCLITGFICLYSFACMAINEHSQSGPSVLLLNSYHPQYQWTQKLSQGVKDVLGASISSENLHIEYMDGRRYIDDLGYEHQLKQMLLYKYKNYQPDIVITSDDHAFYFMTKHGDELFPGKPVVFSGVNVLQEESLKGRENFTGILEGMAIEDNLLLMQTLQPRLNNIILLADSTELGRRMVQRARKIQINWQGDPDKQDVSLEIMDRFTLDQLYSKVEKLPDTTAILMLAIHKDRLGNYFSFEHDLPVLSQKSSVPIYGMWGALMIGRGIIGGLINDPYLHGKRAASIALTVLSGVKPTDIPVQTSSIFSPVFDYNQTNRFSIHQDQLPKRSRIANKPMTIYQENKFMINGIIGFVLFLFIIITVLLQNIKQRDYAQNQLAKLNRELEFQVNQRTLDLKERNVELESINERMEKMAHTDVLTGLGNRRAANTEIESYVNRSYISHETFSLAILDIDFFKQVNDTHGHQAGDDVLFQVSQIIKHALRPSDRVYRWGGEEFIMALPNTSDQFASAVCQRVRKCINEYEHSLVGQVTASIGVTTLKEIDSIDSLIQRADENLYFAKENGRDQVVAHVSGKT